MTTRVVHRPARLTRPDDDDEPRPVEAPPVTPEAKTFAGAQALLPAVGSAAAMTLMLVFRNSSFAAVGALVMVVTVLATGVLVVGQRGQATRQRRQQRERYLDYLERLREELVAEERSTRARARRLDPPPTALLDVVRDKARLWERRRRNRDFLRVRIGTGPLPGRPFVLRDEGTALQPTDAFLKDEARAVVRRFRSVPGMPLRVPLDLAGEVSIVAADRGQALAVCRALISQAVALHAPDDLALALARPPAHADDWQWTAFLPHLLDPANRDETGPVRRVAVDADAVADLLRTELETRSSVAATVRRSLGASDPMRSAQRLLVVLDEWGSTATSLPLPDRSATPRELGITVVHVVGDRLQEPGEVGVRVTVDGAAITVEDLRTDRPVVTRGELDDAPLGLVDGLARSLAPLRLSAESAADGAESPSVDLAGLLGLGDVEALDLRKLWRPRSERDFLRVPLGVDDRGRPVLLDLKEPAQLGMGPHGLCVGATGSGKSELLRTLVLSLLVTHPPEQLSMVLVDYKGGATFAPFDGLPHIAGVITNLADDIGLVERAHTSLAGEVNRRQQVLKDAGNVANITDYQLLRAERDLPPLPELLVIIDEFGELLTAEPDFIELFLSLGRIGRSIGVHLLLSSQRIEAGKLRGLDTYLSYRLGLRTFSESESRTVLDTTDAFELPPLPGFGYLKVDTTVYQRFKSGYVSGPLIDEGPELSPAESTRPRILPLPAVGTPVLAEPDDDEQEAEHTAALPARTTGPTVLSTLVEQLANSGVDPVTPVWLPPLPPAVCLDTVAGAVAVGEFGQRYVEQPGRLRAPMGLLDDPARQWQGRWDLDLTRAGGHLAVLGGPRSGRSTLLRTFVLSLALSHTPAEVAVYGVDLLGGGLAPLEDLPHVGGVASRGDRERVRRTLEEVRGMLDERERVFRERRLDSVESLRTAHAAGQVPELATADVVLVLDGYGQLAGDFEDVEPLVQAVLSRGASYGVHLVATLNRWGEVRMAQQASFGSRVELRLSEPADSMIDRKLAATIRADQPGRVLTDGKLLGQVALPRLDSLPEPGTVTAALEQAVRAVRASWPGAMAPRVRVLPRLLPAADLPGVEELPGMVALGLDETDFSTVGLDLFGQDQHLLVLGDGGSGKTNLLRLVAEQLMARFGPEEIVFAVVDPRRRLVDAVPEDYLGGHAGNAMLAGRLSSSVASELAARNPDDPGSLVHGPKGPRVVLLVDDYDVLTAAGTSPLVAFLPHLSAARDLGLHVVLTRRVAGAARGLYDPIVQALRESGCAALLLSGDRSEGQLLGTVRAAAQPPGRGLLVRTGLPVRTVQTAWTGATDAGTADRA